MPQALIVEILGDAREFGAKLDQAAGKTRAFSKAAGFAGLALAGGLAYGLDKAVEASIKSQASEAQMQTAFTASGESAKKYSKEIEEAQKAGRDLGFSNIDTQTSLAKLEVATRNHSAAIKDLGVAEDLARFKHIDLGDASKILTSAMAGSARAARQLGIQVPTVTDHQEALKASSHKLKVEILQQQEAIQKLTAEHSKSKEAAAALGTAHEKLTTLQDALKNKTLDLGSAAGKAEIAHAKFLDKQQQAGAVIDMVSQRLHGQADAFANTTAGGIDVFHAHVEALEENLGSGLLPTLTAVTGAFASFAGYLAEHTTTAKLLVGGLAALAGVLITVSIASKLYAAGHAIGTVAMKAFTIAQEGENAAMRANPIGLVVTALILLGTALVVAYQKSETFRNIVDHAFTELKTVAIASLHAIQTTITSVTNAAEAIWRRFGSSITAIARTVFGVVGDIVRGDLHVIEAVITLFGDLIHGRWGKIWGDLVDIVRKEVQAVLTVLGDLAGLALSAAMAVGKAIVQGVLDGVGGLFSSLKSKLESTLKSVLSSLNPFSPVKHGGEIYIGRPLAEGTIEGWVLGTVELPSKMSETVRNAVQKAQEAVQKAQAGFASAFSALASIADQAFDQIMGKIQTKSEKALAKLKEAHDKAQALADMKSAVDAKKAADQALADYVAGAGGSPEQLQAIADANERVRLAQNDVNAAVAKYGAESDQAAKATLALHSAQSAQAKAQGDVGLDPAKLAELQQAAVAAQQSIDDLKYQAHVAALEKQAAAERKQLDARIAVEKLHYQAAVAALEASLERKGASTSAAQRKILALLSSFGINFKAVGTAMGVAWIQGLKEAIEAAASGSGHLHKTIKGTADSIKVPHAAAGGIITRPTLVLAGEAGTEAIVPLSRGGQYGFGEGNGGDMIFNFPNYVGSRDELETFIRSTINRGTKRGVRVNT